MKLKKTLLSLLVPFLLAGCSSEIKTLKIDYQENHESIISLNIKLKGFNEKRIFYSLGIWSDKFGSFFDLNKNGYLDLNDLEENYDILSQLKFDYYTDRYLNFLKEKKKINSLNEKFDYKFKKN